jgi:hypothetical protein
MNLMKISLLSLIFLFQSTILSSQVQNEALSRFQAGAKQTLIVRSSAADTSFLKVQYAGAQYDGQRHNLPFLVLTKITHYDQSAKAGLLIRKVLPVGEPHASVIKRFYRDHLTDAFQLFAVTGLSGQENLNTHRLIPFRINANNDVEELVDYEVNWELSGNTNSESMRQTAAFKNQSVLATGDWYKIATSKTGIHKITKSFLESLGIDLSGVDPRNIQLYGNGGKMLPELNGAFRYDDLEENSIYVAGENDGVFDAEDYILFYATGTAEWRKPLIANGLIYEAVKSLYSDSSFYFITVGSSAGQRLMTQNATALTPNVFSGTYDYYAFHEVNRSNFGKSGRAFFGEYFDVQNSYNFNWSDGDFIIGDTIRARLSVVAIHTDTTQFLMSGNGLYKFVTTPSLAVGSYLADYATEASGFYKGLNTDNSAINVLVQKLTTKGVGYLDKLTLNARRSIKLNTKQFQFRDSRVSGPGKICEFSIVGTQQNAPLLWNVSDPLHPFIQLYNANGNTLSFVTATDTLKEFCLAPESDLYAPVKRGKIENQNLHSLTQADYLIVTHPNFLSQANRLAAFHNKTEGYSTAVATTDQIYNEFGSGKQDISAIRDFIRMLYTRGNTLPTPRPVKYVLLMGDGSYNNMERSTVNNSNFIPTYQSLESLSFTQSLATDDFYALMDPTEGASAESKGIVDVGVGRFTCKTAAEINAVIAKIENYYKKDPNFQVSQQDPLNCSSSNESPMGDWRNNLLFLADDGDGAVHMRGADNLTKDVANISKTFNTDKIYIDAYQRISTPTGQRYPDAEEDLMRKIKKGVLLFNYTATEEKWV